MISKEEIVSLLATNDKAVCRALVLLNDRQTHSEQSSEATIVQNGRGFRPCHAHMGTSMAKFYTRNGYLSPKQLAYWRMTDRTGAMRVAIYWKQLQEEAEAKKARMAAAVKEMTAKEVEDAVAAAEDYESQVAEVMA